MKRIYLSGNMTPDSNIYFEWTRKFNDNLISDYNISYSILENDVSGKMIVRHDLARLSKCDVVVVNLGVSNLNYHLTGAIVEIYEAYRLGIPVYAFTSDKLKRSKQADSPWISEFITHEFESYEDLTNFLDMDNL